MTAPDHATRMALPMRPPHSVLSVCLSPTQPAHPCDPRGPNGCQCPCTRSAVTQGCGGAVGGEGMMFGDGGGVSVSQVQQPLPNTLSEKPERCGGEVGSGTASIELLGSA